MEPSRFDLLTKKISRRGLLKTSAATVTSAALVSAPGQVANSTQGFPLPENAPGLPVNQGDAWYCEDRYSAAEFNGHLKYSASHGVCSQPQDIRSDGTCAPGQRLIHMDGNRAGTSDDTCSSIGNLVGGWTFQQDCWFHDCCWQTCGADRDRCDREFLRRMQDTCVREYGPKPGLSNFIKHTVTSLPIFTVLGSVLGAYTIHNHQSCQTSALAIFAAVNKTSIGTENFHGGQRKVCGCCPTTSFTPISQRSRSASGSTGTVQSENQQPGQPNQPGQTGQPSQPVQPANPQQTPTPTSEVADPDVTPTPTATPEIDPCPPGYRLEPNVPVLPTLATGEEGGNIDVPLPMDSRCVPIETELDGTLIISVVSDQGNPVRGACYKVFAGGSFNAAPEYCDDDGDSIIRIENLTSPSYNIAPSVFPTGFVGESLNRKTMNLKGVTEVTATMYREVTLRLHTLDTSGNAINSACIVVSDVHLSPNGAFSIQTGGDCDSDYDGLITIHGQMPNTHVIPEEDGYERFMSLKLNRLPHGHQITIDHPLPDRIKASPGETLDINVVFSPLGHIVTTLTEEDGTPVLDEGIVARTEDEYGQEYLVLAYDYEDGIVDGIVRTHGLIPGMYSVSLNGGGHNIGLSYEGDTYATQYLRSSQNAVVGVAGATSVTLKLTRGGVLLIEKLNAENQRTDPGFYRLYHDAGDGSRGDFFSGSYTMFEQNGYLGFGGLPANNYVLAHEYNPDGLPLLSDRSVSIVAAQVRVVTTHDELPEEGNNIRCSASEISCDEICIDPMTDSNNCGECGTICQENDVCLDGECIDAETANGSPPASTIQEAEDDESVESKEPPPAADAEAPDSDLDEPPAGEPVEEPIPQATPLASFD